MKEIRSYVEHEIPEEITRPLVDFANGQLVIDHKPQAVMLDEHVEETRRALDALAGFCFGAAHVVTFAMGGILPILYLDVFFPEIDAVGHVFTGLNWRHRQPWPKKVFMEWIASLSADETVVIFDTGRVGNSFGTILGVLQESDIKCRICSLIAIAEEHRFEAPSGDNKEFAESNGIELKPILLTTNVFEDRLELMGYEAFRSLNLVRAIEGISAMHFALPQGGVVVFGAQPETMLKALGPSAEMSAAIKIAACQSLYQSVE